MPDPNDLKNLSSQLKKTIIFAESFKGGSSVDPSKNILNIQKTTISLAGHVIQLVSIVSDLAKIVNNNSKKITSLKNISKSQSSRISGKNIGTKLPGSSTSNVEDNISKITKSVISIAEILSGQKKLKDSSTSYDRRKAEQEKRSLAESKLEKRFDGLKKAAEKILAPVKSLLDKIINFLVTVFLGRVVYKLLEWFGDPKNADKVKSIGRFLGDHWPKLLALYLTFGTSFGRFALGLTKAVASGAIKLAFAIAKLLAAKKVKGAMGAARFLGGKGGKITAAVLGTAAAVTGAYALTQGMKGGDEEPKTLKPEEPKIPGYAGGGIIKIPAFKGGGLNFKGMFGGALGSSPEKPQEMPNGFVSGEKGVDKVPAMLSDGEFVMSVGAVQKYGVDTLEGMNAAGGGTNKPKMMGGKTYAAGGGRVGYGGDSGGNENMSMNFYNIKNFIKQKMGYDVDKPETWGSSFSSVFTDKSSGSKPPKSQGKGFDFISTTKGLANQAQSLGQGLANQGMGLVKTATDPRSYQGLANQGMGLVKTATDPRSYQGLANQGMGLANQGMGLAKKTVNTVKKYGRNVLNYVADKPYFGETAAIENERKLGLMKPGADSLTDKRKKQLADKDAYVEGLYDPKKDKGPLGFVKKVNQNIQNKGLFADPFAAAGLKEEGTEKFVEEISRGKIKNFGAKITGLQFALKGLLGPLGKAFQIDDRGSLGRYLRPAMLEAQKRGNSSVGAKSFGQEKYDKLVNDKIANYALGQTGFTVDKTGRAKTKDVFDSNDTAEAYFKRSRLALKSGNPMGALFPGLSGILRANQNAEYSNLRPGGNNIDLGGGFKQTDARGNVLSPQQIEQMKQPKFARPKNVGTSPVNPPIRPARPTTLPTGSGGSSGGGGRGSSGTGSQTPSFSARNSSGARSKQETLGLMR